MDNTISAILEMDRQARLTVETAGKRAEKIISDAVQKKESMERESRETMKEQASLRFDSIKAASDREIAAAEKNAEEKCRILRDVMGQNRETWKKEITARITGG